MTFIGQKSPSVETFWEFKAGGYEVPVMVVGHTREPLVIFQPACVSFGKILLGHRAEQSVDLINTEGVPASISFVEGHCPVGLQRLKISPKKACLKPHEK